MNVEATHARRIEDGLGQQQSVGHDDSGIGPKPCEVFLLAHLLQGDRSSNRKPKAFGKCLDRRGAERLAASCRSRRLAVDATISCPAAISALRQCAAKSGVPMNTSFMAQIFPSRCALVNFLITRSRFSFEM